MWTPLYRHTKFHSRAVVSLAVTSVRSVSCVWAPWPPLLSRGNIIASHLVGLGLTPDQVSFPNWGFFWGFSSTIRQMSGKLRPHLSPDIIGYHNNKDHSFRAPTTSDVDAPWNIINKGEQYTVRHKIFPPFFPHTVFQKWKICDVLENMIHFLHSHIL